MTTWTACHADLTEEPFSASFAAGSRPICSKPTRPRMSGAKPRIAGWVWEDEVEEPRAKSKRSHGKVARNIHESHPNRSRTASERRRHDGSTAGFFASGCAEPSMLREFPHPLQDMLSRRSSPALLTCAFLFRVSSHESSFVCRKRTQVLLNNV